MTPLENLAFAEATLIHAVQTEATWAAVRFIRRAREQLVREAVRPVVTIDG